MIIVSREYVIIRNAEGEQMKVLRSEWIASLQRDEDVQAERAMVKIRAAILRERERQRIARDAKKQAEQNLPPVGGT